MYGAYQWLKDGLSDNFFTPLFKIDRIFDMNWANLMHISQCQSKKFEIKCFLNKNLSSPEICFKISVANDDFKPA